MKELMIRHRNIFKQLEEIVLKTKLLTIIISAVVIVGALVGIGFAIYNNTPEVVAANAIEGMFKDFVERDEIKPIANMFEKGSLTISASELYAEEDGERFDAFDEAFLVNGKIYFSEKELMLDELKFKYGEDFEVSGSVYLTDDMMYVKEDSLFDTTLGITKGDLADDFKNSIFAYGSDSEYAIPDEKAYNIIVAMLEYCDALDTKEMEKDVEKLYKRYSKEIYKIFCDNAEFEAENDEVRLGGEKKKVRVITITFDEGDVANMVEQICEYLCEDEELVEFIEKYTEDLDEAFEEELDAAGYSSIADAYEDLLEDLDDNVDSICDSIKENEFKIGIEIVTPKLSSTLLKLSVSVDKEELFSLDLGAKGIKKTDLISLTIAGDKDNRIEYEVTENTSSEYNAELRVGKTEICEIEVNRKKDTFEVNVQDSVILSGKMAKESGAITIELEEIERGEDGAKVYTDLKIVIDEKDKMPAPEKKFDSISDITVEDIEAWIAKISEIDFGMSSEPEESEW